MISLFKQKILTGIEISGSSVCAAQIQKEKKGWRLLQCRSELFPEDTLQLAYKTKNIINPTQFLGTVKKVMEQMDGKVSYVGLSLPNEIVKVTIQTYEDLPESNAEIEKMIAWWTGKNFHLPVELLKISYHLIGSNKNGSTDLLVSIGIHDIIKEYESNLKELKIDSRITRPAMINQFNFYGSLIPPKGTIAYLGVFENYFIYFVFEDAQLVFCSGVRKGLSDLPLFFENIDRIMHYYLKKNPNKEIEKCYIGSQVGFHRELEEVFGNLSDMDIVMINESQIIQIDDDIDNPEEKKSISPFAAAIGAAQSLNQ